MSDPEARVRKHDAPRPCRHFGTFDRAESVDRGVGNAFAVAGTAMTVPLDQAVVKFAEPMIEGERAEVVVNLWCGMLCGGGTGLVLARSSSNDWSVTDQFGGFVA